jgi:hypothetical protein
MSTAHPRPVGSDPDRDPPATVLDVTVHVEFPPGMPPSQMLEAAGTVADRLEAALAPERFADLPVTVQADVYDPPLRETPLYPLRMGAQTFTCAPDVVEAIEHRCAGTDLAGYARDHAGRTYQLHVAVWFSRVDGTS